jgi:hypothetical protein
MTVRCPTRQATGICTCLARFKHSFLPRFLSNPCGLKLLDDLANVAPWKPSFTKCRLKRWMSSSMAVLFSKSFNMCNSFVRRRTSSENAEDQKLQQALVMSGSIEIPSLVVLELKKLSSSSMWEPFCHKTELTTLHVARGRRARRTSTKKAPRLDLCKPKTPFWMLRLRGCNQNLTD